MGGGGAVVVRFGFAKIVRVVACTVSHKLKLRIRT